MDSKVSSFLHWEHLSHGWSSCKVITSELAQTSSSLAGMELCLAGHEHLHQFSPVHPWAEVLVRPEVMGCAGAFCSSWPCCHEAGAT